jgi:hypothetical protein
MSVLAVASSLYRDNRSTVGEENIMPCLHRRRLYRPRRLRCRRRQLDRLLDPIFQGAADSDLELIGSRTLDGHTRSSSIGPPCTPEFVRARRCSRLIGGNQSTVLSGIREPGVVRLVGEGVFGAVWTWRPPKTRPRWTRSMPSGMDWGDESIMNARRSGLRYRAGKTRTDANYRPARRRVGRTGRRRCGGLTVRPRTGGAVTQ